MFINTNYYHVGNKRYRQRNPINEAVLCFEKTAPRCYVAVQGRRFLRNLWRRCRKVVIDIGYHPYKPCRQRTGRLPLPLYRHIPSQTSKSRTQGGHMRATRRPQDGERTGKKRDNRVSNTGSIVQRQSTGNKGKQFPMRTTPCRQSKRDSILRCIDRRILRCPRRYGIYRKTATKLQTLGSNTTEKETQNL